MITATIGKQMYKVDGLANRGEWFGKTWLIGIGMGFECAMIVVEADNESDAIDSLVDSKYGHLIKTDDPCTCEDTDDCTCEFGGNYGERINTDDIRIFSRCKVNYFAKKDSLS